MTPTNPETTMNEENRFPNDDPNLYIFRVKEDVVHQEGGPDEAMTKREFFELMLQIYGRKGLCRFVKPNDFFGDMVKDEESEFMQLLGNNYTDAIRIIEETNGGLFIYTVHPKVQWMIQSVVEVRESDDACFEFIRTILQLRGGDARYELPESASSPLPPPIPPRQS